MWISNPFSFFFQYIANGLAFRNHNWIKNCWASLGRIRQARLEPISGPGIGLRAHLSRPTGLQRWMGWARLEPANGSRSRLALPAYAMLKRIWIINYFKIGNILLYFRNYSFSSWAFVGRELFFQTIVMDYNWLSTIFLKVAIRFWLAIIPRFYINLLFKGRDNLFNIPL